MFDNYDNKDDAVKDYLTFNKRRRGELEKDK